MPGASLVSKLRGRKRPTGETGSQADAASLRRRVTENYKREDENPSGLIQVKYSLYEGMTWPKIQAFLEKTFPKSEYPKLSFEEERVDRVSDKWIFEIPRSFTQTELDDLDAIRDEGKMAPTRKDFDG